MEIKKIAVIGSGTIGNGIAQVFAMYGFPVSLVDINQELLDKAVNTIQNNLDRMLKKEIIDSKKKDLTLQNISKIVGHTKLLNDVDLVIEAIYENKNAKLRLFNELKFLLKSDCIYASNTSSISITELASGSVPEQFVGMHFMNPV